MQEFSQTPRWNHKQKGLYYKICKKTALAHKFWGDNPYLGSIRPRTVLQWHQACYFLWGTILVRGAQFLFGGHMQWFGGTAPECLPWRRAYCKFTAIYRTVTIAFSLMRYCSKSVLLNKWKLFKTTKRCPKPFSTISFICENTILFVWLRNIFNSAFVILWHYKRHNFAKILAN